MKQNIYIAALLAGMLALAGCGGGSSSAPATKVVEGKTEDGNDGDKTGMTDTGPKTLALPTGKTIDGGGQNGHVGDYEILAGQNKKIGDVYFSCATGGDKCVVTVGAGRNNNSVTYTGGTVTASATDPNVTAVSGATTPTGTAATALGDASIRAAIEGGKIWDLKLVDIAGNINKFVRTDGKTTDLFLRTIGATNDGIDPDHTTPNKDAAYVYWGHWETYNTEGDRMTERNVVWGGSKPYNKKPVQQTKPDTIGASATYMGTNAYVLYNLAGTSGSTTASVTLNANFESGKVDGTVTVAPNNQLATRDNPNIALQMGDITGTGGFGGKAVFSGAGITTKSTSTWKGQFYGPTTKDVVAGDSRKQGAVGDPTSPSHAAGEFRVERSKSTANGDALTINGAFGIPRN